MNYTTTDRLRQFEAERDDSIYVDEKYRSSWSRDIARLIHSHAFRNLQGKAQLLVGLESNTFRNRLTHSLEVSQVAKSIAEKLNFDLKQAGYDHHIDPEVCEFSALAHDIGRPPFGHLGETALNIKMKDSGGFEGNAQTLRILTKLEKKHFVPSTVFDTGITKEGEDVRVGLNLTYRSLASIIKYDKMIPEKSLFDSEDNVKLIKGYYESEENIVRQIKNFVAGDANLKGFSTIENQILHMADDIAYATYDLDDAFQTGTIKPIDLISVSQYLLGFITSKINRNLNSSYGSADIADVYMSLFKGLFAPIINIGREDLNDDENTEIFMASLRMAVESSNKLAINGYYRVNFISKLIGRFIKSVKIGDIDAECPALTRIIVPEDIRLEIEALKNFMYIWQVNSNDVKLVKHRGVEIIGTIFDNLYKGNGSELLPTDVKILFDFSRSEMERKRVVSDYVAGFTDNQALNLYSRLKSGNSQVIFKPF